MTAPLEDSVEGLLSAQLQSAAAPVVKQELMRALNETSLRVGGIQPICSLVGGCSGPLSQVMNRGFTFLRALVALWIVSAMLWLFLLCAALFMHRQRSRQHVRLAQLLSAKSQKAPPSTAAHAAAPPNSCHGRYQRSEPDNGIEMPMSEPRLVVTIDDKGGMATGAAINAAI